jgi:hypothetical protein
MERIQANGVRISRVEISLVDFKTTKRCTRGDSVEFCGECRTSQTRWRSEMNSNYRFRLFSTKNGQFPLLSFLCQANR